MADAALREVGRIGRPHGVRGDLYVDLITDRTERLDPGASLRAGSQWVTVAMSRPMSGRWLVHFDGIDDRTAAEGYVGRTLSAEPLPASDAGDDELWVHDLIGSQVVEVDGTPGERASPSLPTRPTTCWSWTAGRSCR
ncbi:MAG: hypothetical protein QM733_11345 [Ilumatobacteraceae bacterium]